MSKLVTILKEIVLIPWMLLDPKGCVNSTMTKEEQEECGISFK